MKISLLIPCWNEEPTIVACVESALAQERPLDQIIVVNDGSTDNSRAILAKYEDRITVVNTLENSGSKSRAQEYAMQFIDCEVILMTDADTVLSPQFTTRAEKAFSDPNVHAFAGYIKSLKHNWLTACRELDYIIGQDLHKTAQAHLEAVIVIPGCGAGFRMSTFKKYITFDHDTLTEDLDFTYKLHEQDLKIYFDKHAVVNTQDPDTLPAYIKQMRRWIGGGWQCLVKHWQVVLSRKGHAVEISLIYIEGMLFGMLFFLLPFINILYFGAFFIGYFFIAMLVGLYASHRRKRPDLMWFAVFFPFVLILNSYVFFEQFISRVLLRRKDLTWYKPKRRLIDSI